MIKFILILIPLLTNIFLFTTLYAENLNQGVTTLSLISEISKGGSRENISRLQKGAINEAIKEALIKAASKLTNDGLNAEIIDYYKALESSRSMGYIHGYNIVSLNYNDNLESLNLVLKTFVYTQPIINDLNKFNIRSASKDELVIFILDTNFINFKNQPFNVENVILEEFNIKGINMVYFVKASNEGEKRSKINILRQNAKLLVDSKLILTELPGGGVKGFISFKTINARNETIKAMSFSLIPQKSEMINDSIIELIERMVEKLLNNYGESAG